MPYFDVSEHVDVALVFIAETWLTLNFFVFEASFLYLLFLNMFNIYRYLFVCFFIKFILDIYIYRPMFIICL